MVIRRTLILLMLVTGAISVRAQHFAISNNALFDAMGAISAGVEIPTSRASSWELYGSLRPWKRGNISVHKHWLAQAQYRIWPCQVMNGLFYGPYAHFAEFNYGNQDVIFNLLKGLGKNQYEGWLVGGGIGAGYEYALAKHWNIGAEIGVGYTYINYKKSECDRCGIYKGRDDYHYVGISKLGLSIIYVF